MLIRKTVSLLMTMVFLVGLLAACSSEPPAAPGVSSAASSQESAQSAAPAPAAGGPRQDVVIGTAGTAGTYYVVAAAMAQAINNNSSLINVVAQPTKGSIENINLTSVGDIHFGMSNADGVYFAANGTETYAQTGKQNIMGMMSLYMSAGQMVTQKTSGIKSYADLKGKKVCLGPPSTTIVEMSKAILREYGIDPEKDITPFYLAFDEGLQKLTDGEIDATFFVAGVPTAALINASSTGAVDFVEASEEVIHKIAGEKPYYSPFIIPAGTYKGIDRDILTLKIMTEIFVNSDTPEDVVYEFVKQALENVDSYQDAHVVVAEITPETAWKVSAELHPGAAKYYKEIGVLQ